MAGLTGCLGPILNTITSSFTIADNSHPQLIHSNHQNPQPPMCRCGFGVARLVSEPDSPTSSLTSQPPAYSDNPSSNDHRHLKDDDDKDPDVHILEDEIDSISHDLRSFSLKMFEFAEVAMKEFKTHDLLASFMEQQPGWKVTRHAYGIQTAVEAIFKYGEGGQTIGFNSEMDALPGIGHACGHPLICISGIAAAVAIATALEKTHTPGTVILLGTPAEETIGGKILLIEKGAYRPMDACLMLHPAPYGGLLDMFAIVQVKVEYFGKNAHAAGAPWEGINALDAAVSAYNNISVLRQQIHPTERVHGIIQGSEKWAPNVIPDYAYLTYDIRARTRSEMLKLKERVLNCFKASALSSGCEIKITEEMVYDDLINNDELGRQYKRYMEKRVGIQVPLEGPILGSTDFGNVSYEVPAIHPIYQIPCQPNQGNHTPGFAQTAATQESHDLTLSSAKGIAYVGWKVLADREYSKAVYKSFLKSKRTEKPQPKHE